VVNTSQQPKDKLLQDGPQQEEFLLYHLAHAPQKLLAAVAQFVVLLELKLEKTLVDAHLNQSAHLASWQRPLRKFMI
jgi:hypothetical protein